MSIGETLQQKYDTLRCQFAKTPFAATTIGTLVTAFSIFSHMDTFISLSQKIRALTQVWREIIAWPWQLLSSLIDVNLEKTTAGLITVLIATTFVIRSSWQETNEELSNKFRAIAILSCVAVGVLYSAFVIVPALYDWNPDGASVSTVAIMILADTFYIDVDEVDTVGWQKALIVIIVVLNYFVFLVWPFKGKKSKKPKSRLYVGASLIAFFLTFMIDRLIVEFMPFNIFSSNIWDNIMLMLVSAGIILGPFVGSVYLSDPATAAKRSISILSLIAALFMLNKIALGFELIAKNLA